MAAAAPAHAWEIERGTSGMDDSKSVIASQESEDFIIGRLGQKTVATAYLVCRENRTDFFIVFGGLFMSDHQEWGTVMMRLDSEKAFSRQFTESTDHEALGLWRGTGVKFIKSAVGKKRLLVRATPFNERPVEAAFSLEGFDAAVAEVRKTCGW